MKASAHFALAFASCFTSGIITRVYLGNTVDWGYLSFITILSIAVGLLFSSKWNCV